MLITIQKTICDTYLKRKWEKHTKNVINKKFSSIIFFIKILRNRSEKKITNCHIHKSVSWRLIHRCTQKWQINFFCEQKSWKTKMITKKWFQCKKRDFFMNSDTNFFLLVAFWNFGVTYENRAINQSLLNMVQIQNKTVLFFPLCRQSWVRWNHNRFTN